MVLARSLRLPPLLRDCGLPELGVRVLRAVVDTCTVDSFQTLHAGPASAAVNVATLVAGPGKVDRNIELPCTLGNVLLGPEDVRSHDLEGGVDKAVVARSDCLRHPFGENWPAVRVDSVVTCMHC